MCCSPPCLRKDTYVLFSQEPSVLILFAFEFAILGLLVCSTFFRSINNNVASHSFILTNLACNRLDYTTTVRYLLHLVDIQMEEGWQAKHTVLFFIEFATDIMRFFFYFVFFSIVFLYYGLPIYIVRDLWVAYTNIRKRIQTYAHCCHVDMTD